MTDNVKKVLIVDLAKGYGGIEVRILQMAEKMHERYPYLVLAYKGSLLHNYLSARKLNVVASPHKRGSIKNAFLIKKIIKEHHIDVIDAHNPQSQLWGILGAKLAGLKDTIMTLHIAYGESEVSWRKYVYSWIIYLNAKLDARFLTISPHLKAYLRNIGIKNKTTISENCIDVGKYQSAQGDDFRKKLGIASNHKLILNLARLESVKGQKYLINAMKIIKEDHPDAVCVIAGTGRLEEDLRTQIDRLRIGDCVKLPGFINNIDEALAACDIFCLSSLEEGLPYALLEACAAKKPAVCTGVGGVSDFLNGSGSGIVVNPENIEELACGLISLLNDKNKRLRLGESGLNFVKENYSINKMVTETIAFYTDENSYLFGQNKKI